jgi:hypothetical protein
MRVAICRLDGEGGRTFFFLGVVFFFSAAGASPSAAGAAAFFAFLGPDFLAGDFFLVAFFSSAAT